MPPARHPFAPFERARRDLDALFGDDVERAPVGPRRGFSPRVDVYYCGDPPRATVKVELAGIGLDDVGLEVRGRQLLIFGERRAHDSGERLYQQVEIEHGPFRRLVELGADVVAERATASYEDGVLRVDIPLASRERSVRRVPIGPGEQQAPAASEERR